MATDTDIIEKDTNELAFINAKSYLLTSSTKTGLNV